MPIFDAISAAPRHRLLRYGISSRRVFPDLQIGEYLDLLFRSSADLIQLREKDLPLNELESLVQLALEISRRHGKPLILNREYSLALRMGLDGVHLNSDQNPADVIPRIQGSPNFLVGQSVHSLDTALAADRFGVDYLLVSPIFNPLSKTTDVSPIGIAGLAEICSRVSRPVIALGGVEPRHASEIAGAGAAGMAGISWPAEEIRHLLLETASSDAKP